MSCGPVETTFRILDRNGYWDQDLCRDGNVVIGDVIELALEAPGHEDETAIGAYLPPARLAAGCGPCEWFLATDCASCRPRLLRLIAGTWVIVAGTGCRVELDCPAAVAWAPERIAVLDTGRREVLVMTTGGERLIAAVPTDSKGPIALTRGGDLLIVDGTTVRRHDRAGALVASIEGAPAGIERIAAGADGEIWLAIRDAGAGLKLSRWLPDRRRFVDATLAELAAALPRRTFDRAAAAGFCLELPTGGGDPLHLCFDWCGRPIADDAVPRPTPPGRAERGVVRSHRLDSGIPRCRWHRIRIDADLPEGTAITTEIATVELDGAEPDDRDWQEATPSVDFLVDQPPGRYAFLRITLSGDRVRTPQIRRIRLDFPRSTSAEHLPAVFRETPATTDFIERFVSLVDATVEDLDRAIERFPALLDVDTVRDEVLPWLGSLLDVAFDPSWPADRRRALLRELPALYRRRGTPAGLQQVIALATGVTPAIEELGASPVFGQIGAVRLREVRLFGRGRIRARLGSSRLGSANLHSYGDPDLDDIAATAHRIRVQVPPLFGFETARGRARLERLVEAQKPGHVVAEVRVGNPGAIVGGAIAVGIDTLLRGLPGAVLGRDGNLRLRRGVVLRPGRARGGAAITVGRSAAVGSQTVLW